MKIAITENEKDKLINISSGGGNEICNSLNCDFIDDCVHCPFKTVADKYNEVIEELEKVLISLEVVEE